MTEQEWLKCSTDPGKMLWPLLHRANDLKYRLFAVSCCRRLFPLIEGERSRL